MWGVWHAWTLWTFWQLKFDNYVFVQIVDFGVLVCLSALTFYKFFYRQMKTATVTALMLENWMKLNMCTRTMLMQCKRQYLIPKHYFMYLRDLISKFWFFSLYSMDIDYSPTGREFVTGSYDRTVSICYWLKIPNTDQVPPSFLIILSFDRWEYSSTMVATAGKYIILKECKGL